MKVSLKNKYKRLMPFVINIMKEDHDYDVKNLFSIGKMNFGRRFPFSNSKQLCRMLILLRTKGYVCSEKGSYGILRWSKKNGKI